MKSTGGEGWSGAGRERRARLRSGLGDGDGGSGSEGGVIGERERMAVLVRTVRGWWRSGMGTVGWSKRSGGGGPGGGGPGWNQSSKNGTGGF